MRTDNDTTDDDDHIYDDHHYHHYHHQVMLRPRKRAPVSASTPPARKRRPTVDRSPEDKPFMNRPHAVVALSIVVALLLSGEAAAKRRGQAKVCGGRFVSTEAVDGGRGRIEDRIIEITPPAPHRARVSVPSCKRLVQARLAVRKQRIVLKTNPFFCLIAVSTGLDGDRSLGFLVESKRRWVARVDLQTLASGGPVGLATTFLDARTKGMTSAPVVRCPSAFAVP